MELRFTESSTSDNPELALLRLDSDEATVAYAGLRNIYIERTQTQHPFRRLLFNVVLSAPRTISQPLFKIYSGSLNRQIAKDPELQTYRTLEQVGTNKGYPYAFTGEQANVAAQGIHRMAAEGSSTSRFEVFELAEQLDVQLKSAYSEL